MRKDIKSIAEQVATLEKELQLGKDVKENQDKIENIMTTLTSNEMLEVDDYIWEHKLLPKQIN